MMQGINYIHWDNNPYFPNFVTIVTTGVYKRGICLCFLYIFLWATNILCYDLIERTTIPILSKRFCFSQNEH